MSAGPPASRKPKVVVVMPAYNAGRTLRLTYEELPKDAIATVILVDDASTDAASPSPGACPAGSTPSTAA